MDEIREKVVSLPLGKDEIWSKKYTKKTIHDPENSASVWVSEDDVLELSIKEDGTLAIENDNTWIFVSEVRALLLLREAVELAYDKAVAKENAND